MHTDKLGLGFRGGSPKADIVRFFTVFLIGRLPLDFLLGRCSKYYNFFGVSLYSSSSNDYDGDVNEGILYSLSFLSSLSWTGSANILWADILIQRLRDYFI